MAQKKINKLPAIEAVGEVVYGVPHEATISYKEEQGFEISVQAINVILQSNARVALIGKEAFNSTETPKSHTELKYILQTLMENEDLTKRLNNARFGALYSGYLDQLDLCKKGGDANFDSLMQDRFVQLKLTKKDISAIAYILTEDLPFLRDRIMASAKAGGTSLDESIMEDNMEELFVAQEVLLTVSVWLANFKIA